MPHRASGGGRILDALLEKYATVGVYEIEKLDLLELAPFQRTGRPRSVVDFVGGKEEYLQAVRDPTREIYAGYPA